MAKKKPKHSHEPQPKKYRGYVHHQFISLDEGLAAINASMHEKEKETRHKVGDFEVHTTSLRLRVFALKGTKCYICGLKATQFSIDDRPSGTQPHMNLWGVKNGNPMLFTHDHVVDRAKGGADNIKNAEPCCDECNFNKAVRQNGNPNYPGRGVI